MTDLASARQLCASGKLEKAKLGEVKALLKALGQSQTGEKEQLTARVRLYVEGEDVRSSIGSGENPAALKIGDLRKELATRSLPCDTSIETRDELLRRLIDTLKRQAPPPAADAAAGGSSGGGGGGGGPSSHEREIALAKHVLELAETGEDEAILSLANLGPISRASTVGAMRKAYLTLAARVHPDKLGRAFADATKAFQALVGAFERLSQPEPEPARASAKPGKAAPAIARSNANCFRTRVACPRCRVEWGAAIDGVEKYCYNFLMQGLKCFTCSTCLLDFGCMTARHACPHCAKPFDYAPADYHRQVACPACAKEFGFYLFHVPPRVEDELRAEVKAAAERRLKTVESARGRAERAARKAGVADASLAERAFARGLADECPRCGWRPTAAEAKEEVLAAHLKACTDAGAHAAQRKRKAAESARDDAQAAGRARQDEAMSAAAFDMLGGSATQMWLLTDQQLRTRCVEAGLERADEPPLERTERIARLARRAAEADNSRLLTQGGGGVAPARGGGGRGRAAAPTAASLPSNLHSLSLSQLRDVCAAHGFTPKGRSTDALIKELEARRFAGESSEALLLLDE